MAKNDERKKVNLITPRGVGIYPKLNTPDTKFDADGVYEVKLRIDPEATDGIIGKDTASWAEIVEALETLRDETLKEKKAELAASKDPKAKAKAKTIDVVEIGGPDYDGEGEETGNIVIKAKMKASGISKKDQKPWTRKPVLFDAKGKKLPADAPPIYGGSELKVACTALAYYNAKDNVVGVTLQLEAVQVIQLVSGGGGRSAEAYGFGAEDGYEASDGNDDAPFGDTSDAGDGNF